jgi:RHS repeat-associated protein
LEIDEYFSRTDVGAANTSHFLPDATGSALALADSAGIIQTEYTYDPFGNTTATGVANTNAYQYTARENDGTGLYYYRARYYYPSLQRFTGEDPILHARNANFPYLEQSMLKRPQELNAYGYVANNPHCL